MALILVPTQILLAVPTPLLAAPEEQTPQAAPDAPKATPAVPAHEAAQPPPKPAPDAPKVKVNRTLPTVTRPPSSPQFSADPTDQEMFRSRLFEEPLVPLGDRVEPGENKALAQALLDYRSRKDRDDFSALVTFLENHPGSRWSASLLTNLGIANRWTGRFEKAVEAWEEAWRISKDDQSNYGQSVGDPAVGELASMNARLGRYERLEALFQEIEGRDIRGARDKIDAAR